MPTRRIKFVYAIGCLWGLAVLCQKLVALRAHFFVRCVSLYGSPRQAMDVVGIVISPDNRTIAAVADCPDPMVGYDTQFWHVTTRKRLPDQVGFTFTSESHWTKSCEIYGVHRTRAGLIGIISEEGFALRSIQSRKIARRFNAPTENNCTAWTFSPDGKTLWWADKQQRIFWQSIN